MLITKDSRDEPPVPWPEATVLASHVEINGDLSLDGDLVLDGRIAGNLRCRKLVLRHEAEVDGIVIADSAAIWGRLTGDVYADVIELHSTSQVEGAIYHAKFVLAKGAQFEGKSRHHPDPKALAPDLRAAD
jgi:cytoskeletal protein CcmA (bactofilin family)